MPPPPQSSRPSKELVALVGTRGVAGAAFAGEMRIGSTRGSTRGSEKYGLPGCLTSWSKLH
eukprot:7019999-Prymnesium_polylepis.1